MQIGAQEWLRMLLLYAHLILVVFALAQVLLADYRIIVGDFNKSALRDKASLLAKLLVALWVTGLAIIFIDTGFSPGILATKSKLLVKLICAAVLTLNGVLIHYIAMPAISSTRKLSTSFVMLVSMMGAISSSHWLMAAFIGASKPLGVLPFNKLFALYVLVSALAMLASIAILKLQRKWIEKLQFSDSDNTDDAVIKAGNSANYGSKEYDNFGLVPDVDRTNKLMANKLRRFKV